MDALFAAVGQPREFSAQLINQFKQVTIMETGEILSTDAPNELLLNGLLDEDIALSIHVEGGTQRLWNGPDHHWNRRRFESF